MPYVTIKMLEGRTEEQKKAMAVKVTEAITETIGVPADRIHVMIEDMPKTNLAVGGKMASEK